MYQINHLDYIAEIKCKYISEILSSKISESYIYESKDFIKDLKKNKGAIGKYFLKTNN